MSNWQPISTIPRDGKTILVWVSAEQCGTYDDGSEVCVDVSQVDFGHWDTSGEFVRCSGGQIGDFEEVTHWMPLPEPPK